MDKIFHAINLYLHGDTHFSFVLGSISGMTVYLSIESFILEKTAAFIISAITALVFGFLGALGKDLFPLFKVKFKKWWK